MKRVSLLIVLTLSALTGVTTSKADTFGVLRVVDGDTLILKGGTQVRLVQIDAPELRTRECFSLESKAMLSSLIGRSNIKIVGEPNSSDKDQYGRLLRYVFVGKRNINLEMVKKGGASPWFYNGEFGKYANELDQASKLAYLNRVGLWGKCSDAVLDVRKGLSSGNYSNVSGDAVANLKCDPNYQGCVPPFPPDLDCKDIIRMGLAPVRIIRNDLHKFDRDADGIGCDK